MAFVVCWVCEHAIRSPFEPPCPRHFTGDDVAIGGGDPAALRLLFSAGFEDSIPDVLGVGTPAAGDIAAGALDELDLDAFMSFDYAQGDDASVSHASAGEEAPPAAAAAVEESDAASSAPRARPRRASAVRAVSVCALAWWWSCTHCHVHVNARTR